MKKIGIFFGSDTGNTEKIAKLIHKFIGINLCKLYDIEYVTKKDLEVCDVLILGIPTWYYGELQCDWDNFLPIFKTIDFNNKIIALFGCGDQSDYTEYFCDAIGIIYNIVKSKGAKIIGQWPIKGYTFESSKAVKNSEFFYGLVIDEDRQPEKSEKRTKIWVNQIKNELFMSNNIS
ncbi:flavodoxin FldA [Buchnera aphidicola]|uniref:flavodoxin FldA n=1 Tax=Buchnera aphidicola TaxID=9 RepID=UPI0031B8AB63